VAAKDAEADEKNTTIAQVCVMVGLMTFMQNKYSCFIILLIKVHSYPTLPRVL